MSLGFNLVTLHTQGTTISAFERPITPECEAWDEVHEQMDLIKIRKVSDSFQLCINKVVYERHPNFPKFPKKGITVPCPLFAVQFENPKTKEKVRKWVLTESLSEIRNEFIQESAERVGMKTIAIAREFSRSDLKVLKLIRSEVFIYRQKFPNFHRQGLCCFQFTLLQAKDEGVRVTLLGKPSPPEQLIQDLPRWGYDNVLSPKKSDLVLYLDNGVPVHMGLYLGKNSVASKFGSVPFYNEHPITFVWKAYGNQVAFYRKTRRGLYPQIEIDPRIAKIARDPVALQKFTEKMREASSDSKSSPS